MNTVSTQTHGIDPSLLGLMVDIGTLTPDPKNARLHDDRNLKSIVDSYREHGQRKPLVVQRVSDAGVPMVVRAGNGQLAAAKALGWTHIAATVIDEGDKAAIAFAIRDNRTAELAEWDLAVLGESLRYLRDEGIGAADVGWAAYEAEPLMAAEWEPSGVSGEEFNVPDKRVGIMFSRDQFEALKLFLGAKPTAEAIMERLGVTRSAQT
jgi:hypothetical protein